MERHCRKCQTNKPGTEFSPTAVYCRPCVAANKAQSRANKKAGIQAPRGRPNRPVVPAPIILAEPNPAVQPPIKRLDEAIQAKRIASSDYTRFTVLVNKILQKLDESATTDQLTIRFISRLTANASSPYDGVSGGGPRDINQTPVHVDNPDDMVFTREKDKVYSSVTLDIQGDGSVQGNAVDR